MKFRLTNKPDRTLVRKPILSILCQKCVRPMKVRRMKPEVVSGGPADRRRYVCECGNVWYVPLIGVIYDKKTDNQNFFGKDVVLIFYGDDPTSFSKVLELSLPHSNTVYSHLIVSDRIWKSVERGQKYEIQID